MAHAGLQRRNRTASSCDMVAAQNADCEQMHLLRVYYYLLHKSRMVVTAMTTWCMAEKRPCPDWPKRTRMASST